MTKPIIGTDPDQVPVNSDLGAVAFQDAEDVRVGKLTAQGDSFVNGVLVGRGSGNIDSNTAVGVTALRDNTTGAQNTAVGRRALERNTTGIQNTAVGREVLLLNTTGAENTAIGRNALQSNTTASQNTALGSGVLTLNTTGAQNTAVGRNALNVNTTGPNNTALGYRAGDAITTGGTNTIIGHDAGRSITTGSGNTILGSGLPGTAAMANTVLIGANNTERLRIDGSGNVGIGTTSITNRLHVVTGGANPCLIELNASNSNNVEYGLIAKTGNVERWRISAASSGANLIFKSNDAGGRNAGFIFEGGNPTAERMRITNTGNVGIATNAPTQKLDIDGDTMRLRTARTPASAGATGAVGEICWDADYIYICVATNTWKRAAIATW